MEYFRPDVKVGAFIFVALVLLVAAAIVVGGVGDWFAATQEYMVLLPNANLLRRRAKVSYAGSPVGEVTAVTVHMEEIWKQQHPRYPVAVTIVVRGSVLLREDARVEMRTDGFIGERYLDIAPGSGDPVPSGGVIVGSIGGVEGIITSLSGVGSGFGELSEALRGLLGDVSGEQSVAMTLRSLHQLLEELRPHLLELTVTLNDFLSSAKQDIASTSARTGRTLAGVDSAVAETSTELKRLMRELHTSLGEVNKTMVAAQHTLATVKTLLNTTQGDTTKLLVSVRDLSGSLQRSTDETLAGLQRTLARVDEVVAHNDRNLYMIVEHLRDTAADLKATARQVRGNPSVLLWGSGGQKESDARSTSDATTRALQDRGRVGRYDKLQ
jgi:phospholipid/cholesterol/gamma-HCH transport system substrate-binding protein